MKFINSSIIAATLILIATSYGQEILPSEMLDPIDPRLPSPLWELWLKGKGTIGTSSMDYSKGFFRSILIDSISGVPRKAPNCFPVKFNRGDFRFWAGFRVSENWLAFRENDEKFSSSQLSLTINGFAAVKNKIFFYEDIALFRQDNTRNIDEASATGEFLRYPLISYPRYWLDPLEGGPLDFDIYADRAVIAANLLGIGISAGHERIIQKPGYRNGLLFSGLARPIDLFYRFEYRFWHINLISLAGQLGADRKKYIAAKRIDLEVTDNFKIGLSEAVSYSDDPTAYINPIMPVFVTQRQRPNNDDNLLASIDISYSPVNKVRLYGEFLDDDFMYLEDENRGPSKYAFLVGLEKRCLFAEGLDLQIEYCRATKWTYTHVSEKNSWTHAGQPLGFWLGPDADELYCQLSWIASSSTLFRLAFDRVRKGEGSIDLPYEIEGGEKTPPFPSGIVEKSTGGWLDWRQSIGRLNIATRLGLRRIINLNNSFVDTNNRFVHIVIGAQL